VFRVGLWKRLGLLCGGAHHGTFSGMASSDPARPNAPGRRTAREQKAKNVASTMGFGCGR
jgi:hypothetical protein